MYNVEQCFISAIEKWKETVDVNDHTEAFLTDISKFFDCIDHELLLAKPNCNGLDSKF